MKNTILWKMLLCCVLMLALVFPAGVVSAEYNDEKYHNYVNMKQQTQDAQAQYVIPNLYRQDASYTNVKSFPLVVNNSTEYFPLDIFALYPYLEVVYSKITYGFYINNTKNGKYIAFDIEHGTTTTNEKQLENVKVQIFYHTYYVPAKVACEALGMKFETYDDSFNGIRAARIFDDKAKRTLHEMVEQYKPVNNSEANNPDNPPIISGGETQTPIQDSYKKVAPRYIYLTFENCPNQNTDKVLDILRKYNAKAVFFMTKDSILNYPDTARRIISDGHVAGIYFSAKASDAEVLPNELILDYIQQANNALELVTKTKSRFVRAQYGFSDKLGDADFAECLEENGLVSYDWNMNIGESQTDVNTAFGASVKAIAETSVSVPRTIFLRFGSYEATSAVLDKLLDFCSKYKQFYIMKTTSHTTPVSFIG